MSKTRTGPKREAPIPRRRDVTRPSAGGSAAVRKQTHPRTFLIPAFVVLGIFFFLPTIYNFIYAFTDWSSFKSEINPVGFDNFQSLLSSGTLVSALRVTLIYAVLVAIFQNVFGLILALLLERDTRINRFSRVMFFIPVVMSALAVGYIFQALLKPTGALNEFLSLFTAQPVEIAWLGSTTWTIVVVSAIHAWKWMGPSITQAGDPVPVPDVAASFQEAVADVLTRKAVAACQEHGIEDLLIGGGVAANSRLRALAEERCAAAGVRLRVPRPGLCTDNGAMIAALGAEMVMRGRPASRLDLPADSSQPIELLQV